MSRVAVVPLPALRPSPPAYFASIQQKTVERWDQLEADPELAGPWQQLFRQVQSPRHVLSELLQNADDAGAKWASARIEQDTFIFEHDGEDFDKGNFASLCRFGFSEKRNLHTIGFRGVGFKSTFSLGPTVRISTPTLAVLFENQRFTLPVWDDEAPPTSVTTISVRVQDSLRRKELQKNLQEWTDSPASLLFFRHIRELRLGEHKITRRVFRDGPVPNSEWIELSASEKYEVLRICSGDEAFPEDAADEIRRERIAEDITLPPCSVEIVLGLKGDQRMYVVLPTGVRPDLPFSCNAPFLQDPARTGLKDPATSPTNQWLLRRLGQLAAEAMHGWIGNKELPLNERADGYDLLPKQSGESDDTATDCASQISKAFGESCVESDVLLTDDGLVMPANSCVAPPLAIYDVWTRKQIIEVFGKSEQHALSREISDAKRRHLESWDWLAPLNATHVIERLRSGTRPPKPREWDSLLRLWAYVEHHIEYDYSGSRRKELRIVPVTGSTELFSPTEVVRLSTAKSLITTEDAAFLSEYMRVLDRNWLSRLTNKDKGGESQQEENGRAVAAAIQLLTAVGMGSPSPVERLIAQAAASLCGKQEILRRDVVRLTQIAAALDAQVPPTFKYVARNGSLYDVKFGMVADDTGAVDALVPERWIAEHGLHEDYTTSFGSCTKEQWRQWASSAKSSLHSFAIIREKTAYKWSKYELAQFLRERQAELPSRYPYRRESFSVADHDFDEVLILHWSEAAKDDPSVWPRVVRMIFDDPRGWEGKQLATVRQSGNTYSELVHCGEIPAAWVDRFRKLKSLCDIHGCAAEPAELLMRSPDTEPLMGVERFVLADYDTPAGKRLLKLLGVRDTPAGTEKLIQRIRDLSQTDAVPIHEIAKWYDAIDRVLVRCRPDDLAKVQQAFHDEQLILTNEGECVSSHEVFRLASEEALPGAPTIHESVAHLAMWRSLGVADRPSVDLVLRWLVSLDSDTKLEGGDLRRVRSYLQQFSVRIWNECGHWLSLDGVWTPCPSLDLAVVRLTADRLTELFPTVKARCADMRMLPPQVVEQPPFTSIRDLGTVLQYRLTEQDTDHAPAFCQSWLLTLARGLQRVKLPDDDKTLRVWDVAERLEQTAWQPVRMIRVTPHIDGTPAGQSHSPQVLWQDYRLFALDGPVSRLCKPLVDELARPFGVSEITEAIRSCLDRPESWIEEYLAASFELEPVSLRQNAQTQETDEPDAPVQPNAQAENEAGLPPEDATAAIPEEAVKEDDDEGLGSPSDHEPPRQRHERERPAAEEPTLMCRYAMAKGFRWSYSRSLYIHADGQTIQSCESPFHWERYSAHGDLEAKFWVSEQCLIHNGVEMSSDVWEALRRSPAASSLVLLTEDNRPIEFAGVELLKMVEGEAVKLYPSKYRLRKNAQ